jgi:thiamine pyrophosphate-dependent acetolactate synthase large subunit-like protein
MRLDEYFDALTAAWEDQLVVCALGWNADGWWDRTHSRETLYVQAAMGFASSCALGLALSAPEHEVWMLDSDGGLAMNLGGVLTEAGARPGNLKHIVLDNHSFGCLHGAPLVNDGRADYAAIARGAGIRDARSAATGEELRAALADTRGVDRHAFIVADVERPARDDSTFEAPPPLPIEGPEIKYSVGRALERRLGRPVFGRRGF